MNKAFLTTYRFMYPKHYEYLLSQGMGVRWMPEWAYFRKLIK